MIRSIAGRGLFCLALIVVLHFSCGIGRASTAYVDPGGSCGGNSPCYAVIQNALGGMSADGTIEISGGTYNEDISLTDSLDITLQGGWDSAFSGQSETTLVNSVTIEQGSITADGLEIGPGSGSASNTGWVTTTITPQGAIDAGAEWTVDGGTSWNASGASVELTAGSYTLSFSSVTGYYSPASESVTVTAGETTSVSGDYPEETAGQTTGLFLNESSAYDGYTLFAPMMSTTTYLIDNDGNIVHTWDSSYKPGLSVYLLENGDLLRTGNTNNTTFKGGGAGGIVQELDASSNVLWSYTLSSSEACLHHDVAYLPNGHILMIAWEMKSESEAIAAGRNPSLLSDGDLWPDEIIEVDPSTNSIVWQWHVWDHLVQDYDSTKANYGVVSAHPELVDLNYTATPQGSADWTHINSIAYNSDLDQILLSVHNFSEVWVIDHSTTTAEAASHSGGTYGKGGDILYRWGNPQAYGMGTSSDRKLYGQHDATWIPAGYPGAGDILLFNNGAGRPDGNYSSIEEFTPPVDGLGYYAYTAGSAYGPDSTVWTYTAPTPEDFYSSNISSAQRLPNGDTLICAGTTGFFFELNEYDEVIWEYVNPVTDSGVLGTTDSIPTTPQGGQTNQVFRAERYAPDYPGLSGIVQ